MFQSRYLSVVSVVPDLSISFEYYAMNTMLQKYHCSSDFQFDLLVFPYKVNEFYLSDEHSYGEL